jgi:hypothetical protein
MLSLLTSTLQTLRRNYNVAITHIQGGLDIVTEYRDRVLNFPHDTLIPFKPLIRAFARLERQICEIYARVPALNHALARIQDTNGYYEYATPLPSPLPYFATFDDAWTALGQRWNALNGWGARIHDPSKFGSDTVKLAQEREKLFNDYSEWESGFIAMKHKKQSLTQQEKCVCALLDCHLILARQVLKTAPHTNEMVWDATVQEFEQVVELCRIVVEAEIESTGSQGAKSGLISRSQRYIPTTASTRTAMPWVSFDMGIMPVLFHVVWKCRDARVRLKAINILKKYPRMEFLWDGVLVARVARSIDRIERPSEQLEEAAARGASVDEIPLWRRVRTVDFALGNGAREACLTYKRMEEGGVESVRMDETMTW